MVRLKQFADNINFEMELDPKTIQAAIEAGLKDKDGNFVISPNKINDDASITTKSPYVNSKCLIIAIVAIIQYN